MSEATRIEALRALFAGQGGAGAPGVRVGIGDDAAVLTPPPGELVLTVDEQVEGTHFRREWLSLADLGYRATMTAASDVAAMAAVPWVLVSALVLPESITDAELDELAGGQRDAARELGASVVGGNLARGAALSIATTALGVAASPVRRSGAVAGDGIWLAGGVGLAGAAWRALLAGVDAPPSVLSAWRRPRALVAEGRRMHGVAHAAVDLSDGLARDASHLAAASGVRVVLDGRAIDALVTPDLARAAGALGVAARALVLGGGEDYAILCASPVPIDGFVRIGECATGEGVVVRDEGRDVAIDAGFDHFA